MYKLNNRYEKLLGYLLNQNELKSLEMIAKGIGCAKSTVWKDVIFLESILPNGWKIEKGELNGVFLHKPQDDTLEEFWNKLRMHGSHFQILRLILFNNDGMKASQIREYFGISRSTVHRQLTTIRQAVESAGIKLASKPYKLIGDEKRIRNFYIQFCELEGNDQHFSIEVQKPIHSVEFQNDLKDILSKYSMELHIGAFQRLMTILKVSNMRITQGNYVSFSTEVISALKETKYFEISYKLFQYQYLKQCQNHDEQLQEILYVALHLMHEEKMPIQLNEFCDFRVSMKRNENDLLSSLLKYFTDQVCFDLTDDDVFLFHMLQVSKNISIAKQFEVDTNASGGAQYLPYVEEHPHFQSIEKIIEAACSGIPEEVRKEHAFNIFFLLQAAILRKRRNSPIKIALVCHTFVEENYICEVLKCHLGNRGVISTLDDATFALIDQHREFDLVIATNRVDVSYVKELPVMKVSRVLTKRDLLEIENYVENHYFHMHGLDKKSMYMSQFHTRHLDNSVQETVFH